ncbi:MBL fold metallo-hydrolase [Mesobacillus maritimus]|uniref:MBL fold metallo-hydrolase n=1 Tax=Mesobacillus maritimus TaxID=1643336 RepID=UPI00203FC017|nr:MBL fold metallo-hydrolase [Mesobacillus maritimus]MCM3668566.1 MBL fold metallo-hydrolase [Mesobacillus maritimus]
MNKNYIFVIITFLTIIILTGCTQDGSNPTNTSPLKQDATSQTNDTIPEENETQDTSSSGNLSEKQYNEKTNSLSELKVHYLDVGQSDSTLFQYSFEGEDYTILIDAGNWNQNDVVNYLNSKGVTEIDLAIGTHPDADHIGQLAKVLNDFSVGEVWLSGNTNPSQTFQKLLQAIDENDIDYYEPRMGDEFEVGPLQIQVLYPRTISEKDNAESISLKMTYGDVRFIFTGDANTDDELKMIESGLNLEADILQLGHHGSSTSTHPQFLETVKPFVAIYSAGDDNSYGHPHDEVVQRIQDQDIALYGTDVHGTILVTTNGKDYQVNTQYNGNISPAKNESSRTDIKPSQPESTPLPNDCINLNSASAQQLQEIIHIGPERAEELIRLRPYRSIDELSKIKGIGPARIEDIKSQGIACIGG